MQRGCTRDASAEAAYESKLKKLPFGLGKKLLSPPTIEFYWWFRGSVGVRLIPSRYDGQATFSALQTAELAKLTAKHSSGIPGLAGNVNPYEQV